MVKTLAKALGLLRDFSKSLLFNETGSIQHFLGPLT